MEVKWLDRSYIGIEPFRFSLDIPELSAESISAWSLKSMAKMKNGV